MMNYEVICGLAIMAILIVTVVISYLVVYKYGYYKGVSKTKIEPKSDVTIHYDAKELEELTEKLMDKSIELTRKWSEMF